MPARWPISGIRVSEIHWYEFLRAMIRYRTVRAICLHTNLSRDRVFEMLRRVRLVMIDDVPHPLEGVVEVDETYIAGQWVNKPWSVRKHGTKRGRGTSKQPIFGILERQRGVVRVFLVPDVKKRTIMPLIIQHVQKGSTIYSDAYQLYQQTPKEGYRHAFVDHHQHEYGRGEIHSNGMEGFWGFLKRRLKITGGIRRDRLDQYVAEEVWRYNERKLPESEQINRLFRLLREKFGG